MRGFKLTQLINKNQLSDLMWLYPSLPRDKKEARYRKKLAKRQRSAAA